MGQPSCVGGASELTWYADLSPYVYASTVIGPLDDGPVVGLNVGWLDAEHPFSQGEVAPDVVARLLALCVSERRNVTRGFHGCELCRSGAEGASRSRVSVSLDGERHPLGDAEIHVPGRGVTYVAPNLIVHYIAAHHYEPPEVFVDAVRETAPSPLG